MAPTTRHRSSTPVLIGLAVAAAGLALAANAPALSAKAFWLDDQEYLVQNYLVRNPSWASAARFVGEVRAPSTVGGYYQPLTMISLMLDVARGGGPDHLATFHQTSLALHLANTLLIIVLLYLLFESPWPAVVPGLLFGVHPMMADSIAWIAERKTVLATFFALASLVCYVRYARVRRGRWYAAAFVLFGLGLLSKPTITLLPVMLILLDFWPLRHLTRRTLIEKTPFFTLAGVSAVVTYLSQKATCGVSDPGEHSVLRIILTVCHNTFFYPAKLIWPANLATQYPFPQPMDLSHPVLLAGLIGSVVLIGLLLLSLRWTRALVTGWLIFFFGMLPAMGIIGVTFSIASNRYVYFPALGLALILGAAIKWLWGHATQPAPATWRRPAITAVAGLLVVCEILATRSYLAHWRDPETLARHMVEIAPDCAPLHNQLAYVLTNQGNIDEAVKHYQEAMRLEPRLPAPLFSLATISLSMRRLDEAISGFEAALRIRPTWPEAFNNLGIALAMKGSNDQAIESYRQALRLRQAYPEAHTNLALELVDKGAVDEAIAHYLEALQVHPGYVLAHYHLAGALAGKREFDRAGDHYRTAIRLAPGFAAAHKGLGSLLERQGRRDEAIREYRAAVSLDPSDSNAQARLRDLLHPEAGPANP